VRITYFVTMSRRIIMTVLGCLLLVIGTETGIAAASPSNGRLSLVVEKSIIASVSPLFPFRKGNTWGYCDASGAMVIAADYSAAMPFHDGRAVVFQNGKAGLIDTKGTLILPTQYDNIIRDHLLRLGQEGRFALADPAGKLLSGFDFDQIFPERSGLFLVDLEGKYGMIDTAGKRIVPTEYDLVRNLRDHQGNATDLIEVRQDELLGLYDRCGNRISPPVYSRIDAFHYGFAVVQRDFRFGLIDLEGREVVAAAYDNMHAVHEGRAAAMVKGRWGFVDLQGQEVIPFRYSAVHEEGFFQGRAAVLYRDEWIFIDRQGQENLQMKGPYGNLGVLSDGLISACLVDEYRQILYGYLDHKGNQVIPFQFDLADAFSDGFAVVGKRSSLRNSVIRKLRYGVIDRKGKLILPLVVENSGLARQKRDSLAQYGWVSYQDGDRTCQVDAKGRTFDCQEPVWRNLMMEYQQTRCEKSTLIAVSRDGLWGFCDQNGKEVIPPKYKLVDCFADGLALVWSAESEGVYFYVDEGGREFYLAE
jgi:hypothetical protein